MKAIVLSAGQGRRLRPLTERKPKCMLDVGGRSVLELQLRALALCLAGDTPAGSQLARERRKQIGTDPAGQRYRRTLQRACEGGGPG